jgi:hypothetical protein
MTERRLPIPACAAICKNAMNEVCIEECAPKRDCSSFESNNLSLPEMPQYPETQDLTWKERFVIEEAYLKKTIDFIQGRKAPKNDPSRNFKRRPLHHSSSVHGDHRLEENNGLQGDPPDRSIQIQPQATVAERDRCSEMDGDQERGTV